MLKMLNELSGLPSTELYNLAELVGQFAQSILKLAEKQKKSEKYQKEKVRHKLRKNEKLRLQKMKIQRAIMKRYLAGQSFDQIGTALNYHPKTIYKMVRRYEYDLTVLHEIDRDIERDKINQVKVLVDKGYNKKRIVKELNISAFWVPSDSSIERLKNFP